MSHEFKYDGVKNQNLKNGRGTFEARDLMYKGSFCDGLSSGYGVLQLSDKFSYKGNFQEGKFHGLGVLKVGGVLFEGEFSEGRIHGKGRVTFADGSRGLPPYEGIFENGAFSRQRPCNDTVTKAQNEAALAEGGCTNFNHEQF